MHDSGSTLYHVTHTSCVASIRRKGILPFWKFTNWVHSTNGKRYGGGAVYAFEHPDDAVRWAAKMDWEKNQETGSGKVSIVAFEPGDEHWELDASDPLLHAVSKGHWRKLVGWAVKPEQIREVVVVTTAMIRAVISATSSVVVASK